MWCVCLCVCVRNDSIQCYLDDIYLHTKCKQKLWNDQMMTEQMICLFWNKFSFLFSQCFVYVWCKWIQHGELPWKHEKNNVLATTGITVNRRRLSLSEKNKKTFSCLLFLHSFDGNDDDVMKMFSYMNIEMVVWKIMLLQIWPLWMWTHTYDKLKFFFISFPFLFHSTIIDKCFVQLYYYRYIDTCCSINTIHFIFYAENYRL